jgi:hypothetical protein
MRGIQAAVAPIAIVLAVAGCASYGGLRDSVRALTPTGAQPIGRCQEYGVWGVVEEPGYGCAFFAPGTQKQVLRGLVRALDRERFADAVCHPDPFRGVVEVQAKRGDTMLYAEVSRQGSVIAMSESGDEPLSVYPDARYLTSDYERAPAGTVILKLNASTYPDRTPRSDWRHC